MHIYIWACVPLQYGKQLYVNYQEAMKRTEAAYDWSSLSSSSIKSGTSSVSIPGELLSSDQPFLLPDWFEIEF